MTETNQSPDPSACIICGQEHDQSWKRQPDQTGYGKRAEFTSLLFVLLTIFAIALPAALIYQSAQPMGRKRQPPGQTAIGVLHELIQSETSFHIDHGRYGSFEELVNAQELGSDWAKPIHDGYWYSIYASGEHLLITTRPMEYGQNRRRSFYVDSDFVIRGSDRHGFEATPDDPIVEQN